MKKDGCHCSVRIADLGVSRGGYKILRNISFSVKHSEIMALVGRNGAGKTTLLKAIIDSIPHTGKVQFFNSEGKMILSPKIGYVPQKLNFDRDTPFTVLDLFGINSSRFPIWMGLSEKRKNRAYEILKKVGAEDQINKKVGRLSGGEIQRVMLAFALDPMPDILLLDEPISAVDKNGATAFYRLITSMREEFHMPVIIVSHDLAQVSKYATSYALLDGSLVETGKACEMAQSPNIRKIFEYSLSAGGF